MRRVLLLLAMLVLVLIGVWCLYVGAFFAWVTATPVTGTQLSRAQLLFKFYLSGAVLSFVASGILCWLSFRNRRRSRGFEVVQ